MSDHSSEKKCSFPGCDRKYKQCGLCVGHYLQKWAGKELRPLRHLAPKRICDFPGCGLPHKSDGYCVGHHGQFYAGKELTPLFSKRRRDFSSPRIICDEVTQPNPNLEGPCHVFRGSIDEYGYGKIFILGKSIRVHRHCWEQENDPIPDGLVIDHMCRNRACCNVAHLRVVTQSINASENIIGAGWQLNAAKTHCKKGHPFDERSEIVSDGRKRRICRICRYEANRKYLAKKKAKQL